MKKIISTIRRNYGGQVLNEAHMKADPLEQFKIWFEAMLLHSQQLGFNQDPTAMVLSTVDAEGAPDSRVLLLKGVEHGGFVFYTNYESAKAVQLNNNSYAALNFYWPSCAQQVRVRGIVNKVSHAQSAAYFASRPRASQISAIASPQSREIESRQALLELVNRESAKYKDNKDSIACPYNWGGYVLIPSEMEFWQGQDDRLHDRVKYLKQHGQWQYCRLAP